MHTTLLQLILSIFCGNWYQISQISNQRYLKISKMLISFPEIFQEYLNERTHTLQYFVMIDTTLKKVLPKEILNHKNVN